MRNCGYLQGGSESGTVVDWEVGKAEIDGSERLESGVPTGALEHAQLVSSIHVRPRCRLRI
jgi:hypothetical protein